MGSKYYYDCQESAAYMRKYFNMDYYQIISGEQIPAGVLTEELGQFYLDADSVKLLEPQTGDLYTDTHPKAGEIISDAWADINLYPGMLNLSRAKTRAVSGNLRIISRNNKPFLMPKEEIC